MTAFDQRGQKVTYQYNAAGNINFEAVKSREMLIVELQKLKDEIEKANQAGVIEQESATDVQYQIQKSIDKSKKPEGDKQGVIEHLNKAKSFVSGIAQASGIVTSIAKAIQLVQQIL